MPELDRLPPMDDLQPRTLADQIFDDLYHRVVTLDLAPGAKLSEAEVAARMGVSRQPVRDAFYRLSRMGFIRIRPQRATVVTTISQDAVMRAYFIRTALEQAVMGVAAVTLDAATLDALDALIDQQEVACRADQRAEFHRLDDIFHRDICLATGKGFVWTLLREHKGHMDRARFLSLSYGAQVACAEHRLIVQALRDRDAPAAVEQIRHHLGQIERILERLRRDQPQVFG